MLSNVQAEQLSPELADAADVLSDQLRVHLHRLAVLLEPYTDKIDRKFLNRLRQLEFQPKQRMALDTAQVLALAQVTSETSSPTAVNGGALTLNDTSETAAPISVQ